MNLAESAREIFHKYTIEKTEPPRDEGSAPVNRNRWDAGRRSSGCVALSSSREPSGNQTPSIHWRESQPDRESK